MDAVGNVFVTGGTFSVPGNNNAFKITPDGVITVIIDATGDGTGNGLVTPLGIAVDAVGNAFVTALNSGNAFKITPAGVITKIIDETGDGAGNGFGRPFGIAVDVAGNVYVAGSSTNNAFKITPAGIITEIIDNTGDGAGNFLNGPAAIAVDGAGNVYVAGNSNAFKITPAGAITEIIDATGDGAGNTLSDPLGIAVDSAGNAYVTGFFSDNAFKITPAGVITEIIDRTGDGAGNSFDGPAGIAVDAAGNAYVTGSFGGNAFKITPTGTITEIIDETGDGAGNGFNDPVAPAVDAAGNVYVTGRLSANAFKITPTGVITEIIDATGDGESNVLIFPQGIAVDGDGNAYVTGFVSQNAFKITPDCNNNDIPDVTDIANGTSQDCNNNDVPDECEESGACCLPDFSCVVTPQSCCEDTGGVFQGADTPCEANTCVDIRTLTIKDQHCPAPLNSHSGGALKVVLVAEPDFDVTQVVLASLELRRADGVGGVALPNLGPPGPQPQFKDEKHPPFGFGPCACEAVFAKDGLADLRLPFRQDELTAALLLDTEPQGAVFELELTGELTDGLRFLASDCVQLTPPPAGAGMINVQSNEPGVWIEAGPPDRLFDEGGFANFERNYLQGVVVTVTAPRFAGGRLFTGWLIDGLPSGVVGGRSIDLTVSGDHSALASYVDLALGDVNRDGTVDGGDIQGFVDILVSPAGAGDLDCVLADLNGDNQVDLADTTQFVQMLLDPA